MNHIHHCNEPDKKFLNKITFLDSRQREQLIPPEDLISQMPIQKNHTLLDVGAGTGFFTIPMAESTSNKVYAMDPDERMLGVIENKAAEKGLINIELIQDYIENLNIQHNSVDFVMASLILHEVSSLTKALSNIFEVIKTGGHLLCLEYEKDDLIIEGPPMSIRIGSEELEKVLTLTGFEIVKKTKINESIYTVLAVKK
ncbi:class I SAM-dependent methyltransferase [Sedimentibacter saalensis]|uniref:UbiE/COQ5 methyltransferase-like protein n=1 Tax=Sedimentibacter saalensis TaxID=130788 RepID=A0A562J3K9_9FIRM|nr:class I SAM-dependent methyltransferase [Sedimentibacter saalensis]TWH77737.1 ubiE/COQ5 methyltransferase-like protein [Sedimentibacter saalensis]